jgi:pimeloyl-ACP methyl ester carboxylesterase
LVSEGFASSYDNSSIVLDDLSLSYREEGISGKHSLILLHGLNAHSGTWRNNINELSKELHVLAPSLPQWHGSPQTLDITGYVKIVDLFLERINIRKIVIAGNSMGGWIGMRIALEHPDYLEGIVLEDSAGVSSREDSNLLTRLDESGIPVLIIWGNEDKILPVEAAKYLHSKIRDSTLIILESTGHVPHWERPEKFNQSVLDFVHDKVRKTK